MQKLLENGQKNVALWLSCVESYRLRWQSLQGETIPIHREKFYPTERKYLWYPSLGTNLEVTCTLRNLLKDLCIYYT